MSPFDYLGDKAVIMLVSTASAAINFGFACVGIVVCVGGYRGLRARYAILGAVCMALIYLLPQFIVEYLFFYPEFISQPLDSFFLYPNPVYVFPFFAILVKVMGISRQYAIRLLEDVISAQYIILLLFRILSGLWTMGLASKGVAPLPLDVDMLAMCSVFAISALTLIVLMRVSGKNGRKSIPNEFYTTDMSRGFRSAFLSVLVKYLLVSLLGIQALTLRRSGIGMNDVLIYATLIMLFSMMIIENARKRRLSLLEWSDGVTNEYLHSMMSAGSELRGIRHDLNNILQVYGGYISMSDIEGLKRYHESVVATSEKTNEAFDLITSLSDRRAVYTLLQLKLHSAERQQIHMQVGPLDALSGVYMNDLDLCRIIGNLLDNALEAAAETSERLVEIKCTKNRQGNVRLEINNSTAAEVVIGSIFKRGWTQKKNHSGLGLYTVRQILSAYENCYMLVEQHGGLFRASLTLRAESSN